MAHIHNESGQIDFVADVFVVYQDKVLIRLHDKYKIWIAPGGHIELDEAPEDAAIREVEEEIGLKIKLWDGLKLNQATNGIGLNSGYRELIPPVHMNMHYIGPDHRHISMVYFATAETDTIVQPENHENTQCRWMSREELEVAEDIAPTIKTYALKALECLGAK